MPRSRYPPRPGTARFSAGLFAAAGIRWGEKRVCRRMELRVIQGARYSQARERRVLFSLLRCGVCPRTWELEGWTQSGPLADRRDCNRRGRQVLSAPGGLSSQPPEDARYVRMPPCAIWGAARISAKGN